MNEGHPVQRFLEVQEAWEHLRDDDSRDAHRRRIHSQEASPKPNARPAESSYTGFRETDDANMSVHVLEFELEREMAIRGGRFITRIPVESECPACRGRSLERVQCDLCRQSGSLLLRVRAEITVPQGVENGLEYALEAHLELFGRRQIQARIFLI